ncbi:TrbI/VirB10 family protein [Rickettsiales endosymbiont of Stachyamoeba lipophora]|uniref:TrbI/VirB10 family protein n=1 Tax=Rickettsiales endosymbiont of Stachyamoeba lipophora TaxID=2486578 RepID=UPI000F6529BB|nr:TrbI/VirB10 family protein [Rickettsiales endosymbiont of Stachyamoeba lipophora]AZL16433.1 TrbI/VirB10 family protein [Rickettsiales endosymbiont of Stachyamoeba lipophora]
MDNKQNLNNQNQELEQPEIEKGISPVAALPAKNIVVIVVFIAVIIFMIYMLFFSSSDENKNFDRPKLEQKIEAVKPPEEIETPLPSITSTVIEEPKITMPEITAPEVAPPPPPPPIIPQPAPAIETTASNFSFAPSKSAGNTTNNDQRKRSPMVVVGGSESSEARQAADKERLDSLVINSNFTPKRTTAEQVVATRIGDLTATIAQGKIIDAILESAINTDFPGYVRAIVSRDVYAEQGKKILVPKGSRLVGVYAAEIKSTQKRVMIAWNRLIRPDGIDIMLDSPSIDQIGRAGTEGVVDTKFFEIFTNALLMSIVNYAIAYQSETFQNKQAAKDPNISGIPSGSTTTTNGIDPATGKPITTTTEPYKPPSIKALDEGSKTMQDAAKKIVDGLLDERPTITIDQGTRIKVFVRKDLVFPNKYSGGATLLK